MLKTIFMLVFFVMVLGPVKADAQDQYNKTGWGFQKQKHRVEITALGGYVWTKSKDVRLGETQGQLDIPKTPFYGIALDANIAVGSQLELLYQRQESDFVFTAPGEPTTVAPMTVEYFHVGAIGGIQKGPFLPFTQFTLGTTKFAVDGTSDPDWKFSIMLGIGVKYYLTSFLALRAQARLPITFVGGDSKIGCGPHGCFTTVGGWAIAQYDVSFGVALLL